MTEFIVAVSYPMAFMVILTPAIIGAYLIYYCVKGR